MALSRQILKCICPALHFKLKALGFLLVLLAFYFLHFICLLNSNINSVAECLERGLVQVPKKHQSSKRMWHFIAIDYLHSHLESSDSFSSPAFVLAFERVVSDTQSAIICKTNLVTFYQWILLANSKTAALTSRKFFFGSMMMFSQATHT